MYAMPSRRPRYRGRVLQTLGLVIFAAAVGVLVWFTWIHASKPPVVVDPIPRPVAVFIGDSYAQGSGKWPELVSKAQGWRQVNLGRGGTGYEARLAGAAAQKGCGLKECPSFAEMAAVAAKLHPDVVVVAGGRNDRGANIEAAVHETLTTLREALPNARIIAVQPMWDASDYPDQLLRQERVIEKEVTSVDGEYLKIGSPLEGRPKLVQKDGVHPTVEGQRVLAAAVNEALSRS
jgi:acyl-CoA thioesterase I